MNSAMARSDRQSSESSTLSTAFMSSGTPRGRVPASAQDQSTPPTSVTDESTVSDNAGNNQDMKAAKSSRAQRARNKLPVYNETVLSRATRVLSYSIRKISGAVGASAAELVQTPDVEIKLSSKEWSLPREAPDALLKRPTKRNAIRSSIAQVATTVAAATTSNLGKRTRAACEAGKDAAAIQPGESHVCAMEQGPASKKIRKTKSVGTNREEAEQPGPTNRRILKPRKKLWLRQGLYVGQEPDFDPRLTMVKNLEKRKAAGVTNAPHSKILPLPMFSGARLFERDRPFKLPYNIFSPLPPGQPRPDEWRKTRKNRFVGDAAEHWKRTKLLELSKCNCQESTGCDEDCLNRSMFYECDDRNCNLAGKEFGIYGHCGNRSFADLARRVKVGSKYNIGVEVMRTMDRGFGVRSNRTFEPGQIIVEYAGEIITQDECDDRVLNAYKDAECFYLMVFDQNMIIDATRGSIARFVNHSCEPNCHMVKWTVAGEPRMALFAGEKGIMTGDELTYDYNFDPFSSKDMMECRCGAENCRGVLGPTSKDRDIKEVMKPTLTPKPRGSASKRKLHEELGASLVAILPARKVVKSALGRARREAKDMDRKARAMSKTAGPIGTGSNQDRSARLAHRAVRVIAVKKKGKGGTGRPIGRPRTRDLEGIKLVNKSIAAKKTRGPRSSMVRVKA